MKRRPNWFVALIRYVGRTCSGFWRSVLVFAAAIVLLGVIVLAAARASGETVWMVGVTAAVSLWGIFFTWQKSRTQVNLIRALGEVAKAGVALRPSFSNSWLGGDAAYGAALAGPTPDEDAAAAAMNQGSRE